MARIQIIPGTRYVHKGCIFCVSQIVAEGRFRIENQSTGTETNISYDELVKAWDEGSLRFELVGQNTNEDPDAALNTRYTVASLDGLPAKTHEEVWRRYKLVLALYAFYQIQPPTLPSRRQIEVFLNNDTKLNDAVRPNASTLERHAQAFVASGGDIRALIPQNAQRGGKGRSRLDNATEKIIVTVLEKYAVITQRISTVEQLMTDIRLAIADENRYRSADEQLQTPSTRTIRRRIRAAGEQRILGRKLSRREQKANSESQQGIRPTRILERVEIDHTVLDLFVVDERDGLPIGRPHITACIDKYSALVPGWHIGFNQGGYESIMLCLQHAFLPKPDYRQKYGTQHNYPVFGLFEKLCIDNGKDFKGANLKNTLAELGIIREQMPPQAPWYKGSIERYFRTVNQRLLKGKPGYSFGNVVALGDYDPEKDAVISFASFLEIFHIFMVDIYPHSWHKGIEAIPMQRWHENAELFSPVLFENATTLRRILLPSAERVLQPRGIEWSSNFYRSPAMPRLRELHGKTKVRFKYDPDDINVIYVRDEINATGWTAFHSANPAYTKNLSLAKHRIIRQYIAAKKQRVDHMALAQAKRQIQQIIEQEYITTKKLRKRSRLKPLLKSEDADPSKLTSNSVPTPQVDLSQIDDGWPELEGWSSDYDLPLQGDDVR